MRTESRRVALSSGARTTGATLALVVGSFIAILVSGCSTGSNTLARVGDATISVDDFRAAAQAAGGRYPPPPDSAKARLLDDLVQRALLAQGAVRGRLLIDSVVQKHRAQVEEQAEVNALVQQLAPKDVPVSDAEVRALYDSRDTLTHCALIYTMEESMARGALDAVRNGEPFAAVADRFNPPGALPPGGDLGFIAPGTLVEPADRVIRTAPVGSVQGPLRGPGESWFVVQIVERKRQPQPPFESESTKLRGMLEQRKQRIQAMRAFDGLKAQYRLATNPAGVTALFQHFNTPRPSDSLGGRIPPPRPTPEQLETVLGRWDGGAGFRGAYTMKDAFDDIDAGRGEAPNPSVMTALEQWIQGRLIERVALVEARRRHLAEQPEVARRVRDAMNDYLAESMYRWGVSDRTTPSEDDVRASYQRNSGYFSHLVSARFQYLTFPDSAMASGAYSKLQGTKSLRDAVLLSSSTLQVHDEVVTYPSQDPVWSMLEGTLTHAAPGSTFGPLHLPAGWRIVQLVSKDERVPKFEALPQNARQSLVEDATQRLRSERFTVFLDSLRRVIPVTIDRKKLARLPWPEGATPSAPIPMGG